MSIKVKLFVNLWIPTYAEPSVFVTTIDAAPQVDYMPLGQVEVEFPVDMPTKAECLAYRQKMENNLRIQHREFLLTEIAKVEVELKTPLQSPPTD